MTLRASKITFGVTVASAMGGAIGLLASILTGALPAQAGQIFQGNTGNNAWNPIGGCATDVGVGANGAVWVIGCNPVVGGYGIHNWQGGNNWRAVPGGAKHIAVRPNGLPVVVNNDGVIFTGDGKGTWNALPGCARDVGVGANDRIWIVGCNAVPGGYTPYYWNGYWQNIPGGITRISVKPNGDPVATNSEDAILAWNGSVWQSLGGSAKDISAGADGSLWVIGNDQKYGGYGIHKRVGSTWQLVDGGAAKIAVDPQGKPWIANNVGDSNPKITQVLDSLMGIKRITDPNGGYLGQCVSFVKTYADRLGIKLGVFRGPESDQYYQDGAKYGFLAPLSPAEKYEKITFNGNERPQVGDIIFFNNKTFGHVAVINKVLANGDIEIQESNADNLAPNTSVTRKVISLKKGGANTYDDVLGWLRLKL